MNNDNIQPQPSRQPANHPAFQPHYSISDLAKQWNLSRESIRLLVLDEPGVLRIRMGKKKAHTHYSIPADVAIRIHNRLVDLAA